MKLRTRLILTFGLFTSAVILGFIYVIAEEIRPRYLEAQEEVLVDFSETLAALLSENAVTVDAQGVPRLSTTLLENAFVSLPQRALSALIYSLNKDRVDTRIYVTDRTGQVVFDSDNGRSVGEDYSRWRDVRRTLSGKYGARTTWGDPIYPDGDTMYIARPILYVGEIVGVVSVGKPTRNVDLFITNLLDKLWVSGIILAAGAGLIVLLVNLWLTRPLAQLQRYALSLSQGARVAPPNVGNNEVGDVGKALESMREKLDGKHYIEEYVQSLTHELKAPIAGIRGAAELLDEPMPESARKKFTSNIVGQSERMQDLVERLLELAELENATALTQIEQVDLEEITDRVCDALSDQAKHRGVSIVRHLSSECVTGDTFLIQQTITNVLKNAIEHAKQDTQVTVSIVPQPETTILEVANTGEHIPDYAAERIFERFYSLTAPSGLKSTGIGLSFVREIMTLHHGSVSVVNATNGVLAVLQFPSDT